MLSENFQKAQWSFLLTGAIASHMHRFDPKDSYLDTISTFYRHVTVENIIEIDDDYIDFTLAHRKMHSYSFRIYVTDGVNVVEVFSSVLRLFRRYVNGVLNPWDRDYLLKFARTDMALYKGPNNMHCLNDGFVDRMGYTRRFTIDKNGALVHEDVCIDMFEAEYTLADPCQMRTK